MVHGHNRNRKASPTMTTWRRMIDRCHNPKHKSFALYGAQGVTVCPRWRADFCNFLADMGERPEGMTLDRIHPELGYFKANCRWLTVTEQNRRRSCIVLSMETAKDMRLEYSQGGVSLKMLAARYGCGYGTVQRVIAREAWI